MLVRGCTSNSSQDLSVFRIKDSAGGVLNLEQIDVVFGMYRNQTGLRKATDMAQVQPLGLLSSTVSLRMRSYEDCRFATIWNQWGWQISIRPHLRCEFQRNTKSMEGCMLGLWRAPLISASAKCDYGSEESLADTETFAVRIPKLDRSYVNQEHDIEGGDMHFRRLVSAVQPKQEEGVLTEPQG